MPLQDCGALMAKKDTRRDCLTLEAVGPGNQPCEVLISHARMQAVGNRSMGQAKECGYIVPAILQNPTAIFEGLREDEDEDQRGVGWRCYCGIPSVAYHPDGTSRGPYPNQVYLVFVNDENVAYNWRWEKCDPDDPELPQRHQTRFKTRLK